MTQRKANVKQLATGDRVVFIQFGWKRHGTIAKCMKRSARVQFDDGEEFPVCLNELRAETAEDRNQEAAVQAWYAKKPPSRHVQVADPRRSDTPREVLVGALSTAEEMREASRDLAAFADWFDQMPPCADSSPKKGKDLGRLHNGDIHPHAGKWRCARCECIYVPPAKLKGSHLAQCPGCGEADDVFPADDGGWERAEEERAEEERAHDWKVL